MANILEVILWQIILCLPYSSRCPLETKGNVVLRVLLKVACWPPRKTCIPYSSCITHELFLWFPCSIEENETLEAAVGYFSCFSKCLNHMRTDVWAA